MFNKRLIFINTIQDEVAQVACKSACSHIAKAILGILISEDVKQISMGALQQVNLDTIQCERMRLFLFINKIYNMQLQNISDNV